MDLTAEEILSSELSRAPLRDERAQRQRQEELVFGAQECDFRDRLRAFLALGSLGKRLQHLVNEEFNNPAVLRLLKCIVDAVELRNFSKDIQRRRIRHWISQLVSIGGKSVQGFVFTMRLDKVSDTFLAKVNQKPSDFDDALHEYFVGAFGTNKIREKGVPNFAYLYGFFSCSPPVLSQSGRVLTWCTKNHPTGGYIVQEKIPGITLKQRIPTLGAKEFINLFVQIVLALREAQEVGFTHYDLHTSNVILRKLPETSAIEYAGENGEKKILLTDTVATLIDYGFAHVEVQGKHYGYFFASQGNVDPKVAFPLHDVFKLLCFSLYEMKRAGNDAYSRLLPLLSFFVKGDLDRFIRKGRDSLYALPNNEDTRSFTLDDFLAFLHKKVHLPLRSSVPRGIRNISRMDKEILSLEPVPSSTLFQTFERKQVGFPVNEDTLEKQCAKSRSEAQSLLSQLLKIEKKLPLSLLDNVSAKYVSEYFADYLELFENITVMYDIHFRINSHLVAQQLCEKAQMSELEDELDRIEDEVFARAKVFLTQLKEKARTQDEEVQDKLIDLYRFERVLS
jgi:serine/threonine protein kinase